MHVHGWSLPATAVLGAALCLTSATGAAASMVEPPGGTAMQASSIVALTATAVTPTRVRVHLDVDGATTAPSCTATITEDRVPLLSDIALSATAGTATVDVAVPVSGRHTLTATCEDDAAVSAPARSVSLDTAPFAVASSTWVLVNKARPLTPARYVPASLVKAPGGDFELRKDVAAQAAAIFAAASRAGMPMRAVSGYRSYRTQAAYYRHYAAVFGRAAADRVSARPGHSEHQTGLALDVGSADRDCELQACFAHSALGRWVADHAHRYGFIVRYPEGETAVTGYAYEPWHLRYVGVAVATDMRARQMPTLEQYVGAPAAPSY